MPTIFLNNALNAYQSVLLAFYVIVGQLLSKAGKDASLMRSFLTVLPVRELTKYRMPRNNAVSSIIEICLNPHRLIMGERFALPHALRAFSPLADPHNIKISISA